MTLTRPRIRWRRHHALVLTLVVLPLIARSASSQVDSLRSETISRDILKTDFGIELLGNGLLYSFSYQQLLSRSFGIHVGISALGGSGAAIFLLPVGGRFYLAPRDGSPFLTGGAALLSGTSDAGPLETNAYGFAGLGFEYRAQGGFLFRGTAYSLFAEGEFLIWPGLYVGYAY